MSNFEIVFSRPWFLLLLLPIAAIILFPFLRLPARRRKHWKKIVPVVLHMVVCILLVLCLSGVSFIIGTDNQTVMILMDLSDSTEDFHDEIVAYANDLIDKIDEDVGVLAFAGNCVYEVELEDGRSEAKLTEVVAEDTDIAAAMEYAATLLPSDKNRRIILLSDGKQTSGDADATASALAKQGYRIDAVYIESTYLDASEMQVSDVVLPRDVYAGDTIDVLITVESNVAAEIDLILYDGTNEVSRSTVSVTEGSNSFSLSTVTEDAGVHTYRVAIESDSDSMTVNNMMYSYVNVAGESGVLIVADDADNVEALSAILDPICELTVVESRKAPNTMIGLCDYDEIILVNVDADDLPSGFDELLKSYVADYGRSVLTVGGDNTYMYGNMEGTAIEEIMPVQLSLTEDSGGSVAVMLVLDCSMSMSNNASYLSIAKQSAIQSVNAMSEKDYVGVISFNRSAYLKSSLVQATDANKSDLNRIISGLTTSQGTYYTEALEMAHEELLKSDAGTKHVIFLSDGEPSDRGYTTAVQNMADDGITVSTIALGYSSSVLSGLANLGGGRYYAVTKASDLPDIMLSETEQVAVSSLITGTFVPVLNSDTELPAIYGYLGTTLKEGAEAIISTEDGNPIYAVWNYGIGTVASFMSDLEGEWSSDWLSGELGKLLIERMMTTTVDDTHNNSSLTADFSKGGNKSTVVVQSLTAEANNTLALAVATPDGESLTYVLKETSPGVYKGDIDTSVAGIYQTMIVQYDENGSAVDYLETALAISYSSEYNAFAESGEGLLSSICSHSGGIVSSDTSLLADVEMENVDILKDPLVAFAIICAVLMLADFIIRLLRWKDVKEFLFRLKLVKRKN